MDYLEKKKHWETSLYFDAETRAAVRALTDATEIQDRFEKDLDFGTGGLRGLMGVGTNRMNRYTIRKATQGLANYINQQTDLAKSVAIAYDSRRQSKQLALETAGVLLANQISVYLFDQVRPTPELSFAVRELACIAGVVITASHNPPEYNGYKVYWRDGGQIVAPKDREIKQAMEAILEEQEIRYQNPETEAPIEGLTIIGSDIDRRYLGRILERSLFPQKLQSMKKELVIAYTPLHGVGGKLIGQVMAAAGFTNFQMVEQQAAPNGEFPTIKKPNPEEAQAFDLVLKLADSIQADIVLATDPDCDRLGVYVKTDFGYQGLTGNMVGVLMAQYVLTRKEEQGQLAQNSAIVTTIVSTKMIEAVAEKYGVRVERTLTGFKYIGAKIEQWQTDAKGQFEFGFEESCGYLVDPAVRDKDAVAASLLLAEMAVYYRAQGKNLWQVLQQAYQEYGYYKESLITKTKSTQAMQEEDWWQSLMEGKHRQFGGRRILQIRDYQTGRQIDCETGIQTEIRLPKSAVLYLELENKAWVCLRPSGTEPKMKYYCGVWAKTLQEAEIQLEQLAQIEFESLV